MCTDYCIAILFVCHMRCLRLNNLPLLNVSPSLILPYFWKCSPTSSHKPNRCSAPFQVHLLRLIPRSRNRSPQVMQLQHMIHQAAKTCHPGSQSGSAHAKGWPPHQGPLSRALVPRMPNQSLSCTGCVQQSEGTRTLLLTWQSMKLSSRACLSW